MRSGREAEEGAADARGAAGRLDERGYVLGGVGLGRIIFGLCAIVVLFALFAVLMWRAQRTHTRKVGGRTYWDIRYGRFPRIGRRKKK